MLTVSCGLGGNHLSISGGRAGEVEMGLERSVVTCGQWGHTGDASTTEWPL